MHALGELAIGDGVVAGEQPCSGAAGSGVGGELDCARAEGGPVGVAGEDGLDQLGKSEALPPDSGGDRSVGDCGGELWVGSVQVGDAAFESLVAVINRHRCTSREIQGNGDATLRLAGITLEALTLFLRTRS